MCFCFSDKQAINKIAWKAVASIQSYTYQSRSRSSRGTYCSDCNRSLSARQVFNNMIPTVTIGALIANKSFHHFIKLEHIVLTTMKAFNLVILLY